MSWRWSRRGGVCTVALLVGLAASSALAETGLYDHLDLNGDGRVDDSEFFADASRSFAKVDRNLDSVLDLVEWSASETEFDGHLPPAEKEARNEKHFKAMDLNGDKRVTFEEFLQSAEGLSEPIDTNRDGQVTFEEFRAARAKR